jgi:selenocysteine-specific elongation factor
LASDTAPRPLTLGTAGHIDHGKTALVAALTGTDTDRLAEERRRGISIELGFAELDLGGGRSLSVVDVPGHERLVRTMVAGASGIDLFMLVVAADDGVMPQTREHVAVLRALGVDRGIVALTKTDLADAAARATASEQARALLPDAQLIEVSARTGAGLDELKAALARLATETRPSSDAVEGAEIPILHADRVFTLHGIGTVVTGTLQGGPIGRGDPVEVLPGGLRGRARSVETHGRPVERGAPGQRVAVNLAGVDRSAVDRGDLITSPGSELRPSYRLDVELSLEPDAGDLGGERVQVHHGTRDAPARVVTLGAGRAQLRLESPLIARAGDRFVVRRIAPPDTLGGGAVLDPSPRRHGPHVPGQEAGPPPPEPGRGRPEPSRIDRRALLVLALLRRDGAEPRSVPALAEAIRADPGQVEDSLAALVSAGQVARAGSVYFAEEELARLREGALELARETGELTLPGMRDALGTSRKYAQAILEHLDSSGLTVRHGDRHVLRRPRA